MIYMQTINASFSNTAEFTNPALGILRDKNSRHPRNHSYVLHRQSYNLIPILNVRENITLPIELDAKAVNKDFIMELMTTLHISDKEVFP